MTTAEQLHLDILTAPLACVDRRALSQAWYSALYGDAGAGRAAKSAIPKRAAARAAQPPRASAAQSTPPCMPAAVSGKRAGNERVLTGLPPERRMPRAPLAKKIERTLLRPGCSTRSATFRIGKGRVHVVVQQRTNGLALVALCARGTHASVAQALMQARFALAQRGISLETKLYEEEGAAR